MAPSPAEEHAAMVASTPNLSRDSSTSTSSSCRSNFSFSAGHASIAAQYLSNSWLPPVYADEIFLNGKIRPLQPLESPAPLDAIALFAEVPLEEDLHSYNHYSAPASPIESRALGYEAHHRPSSVYTQDILVTFPGGSLGHSSPKLTSGSLGHSSPKLTPSNIVYGRALSLLRLRRVFHINEYDMPCSSPSNKRKNCLQKFTSSLKAAHYATKNTQCTPSQAKSLVQRDEMNGDLQERLINKNVHPRRFHALETKPKQATPYIISRSEALVVFPTSPPYNAQRARAETTKKKTFLPYRQGLLACIGY